MGRCPCDGGAVALLPQQASQAGLPCVQPALRNLPGVLNPIPWGLLTGTAPGGRALAVPPAPAAPRQPRPSLLSCSPVTLDSDVALSLLVFKLS